MSRVSTGYLPCNSRMLSREKPFLCMASTNALPATAVSGLLVESDQAHSSSISIGSPHDDAIFFEVPNTSLAEAIDSCSAR